MKRANLLPSIFPRRLQEYAYKKYFEYCQLTWRWRPLPDFIVLGTQRSGTTSLHKYLNQHPQVASSMFSNEIHFFDGGRRKADNFEKGEPWYRAHFPLKRNLGEGSKLFDSTPLYLVHPLVPGRIFGLLPKIQLIVVLRNPTERAISHYFMVKGKNREPLPMLEAFQEEEQRLERAIKEQDYRSKSFIVHTYKTRGRYAEQLERYLRYFPRQQILLLESGDFFRNPQQTLRRVFDFVGVDAGYEIPDLTPRNTGRHKGEVPRAARDYLNEYFYPFNQELYELTGINFNEETADRA